MKKFSQVFVLTSVVSLFFIGATFAAEKTEVVKIGIVDMQKVVMESRGGQEARAQIEGEKAGKKKLLSEREEAFKRLILEIKKGELSEAEKKEKEERAQKEARELKRLMDDTEVELQAKDKDITKRLIGDILNVIKKVGEEGKYTIILEKDARVLYMPNTIDITSKVIESYDSKKTKK